MKRTLLGVSLALCVGVAPLAAEAAKTPASLNAGISNFNRGYITKAIPLFERATKEAPGNETGFLWLARAYYKQGGKADFDKAKSAYQKVLAINPNNFEALGNLGEMLSWEPARRAEAVDLLTRAHHIKPGDTAIARKLAEALFWSGKPEEALQYAMMAGNAYPNDKKWMATYAEILTLTGHADRALEIQETTLKIGESKDMKARLDYALALNRNGQQQRAQAVYESIAQAVEGTPKANDPAFVQQMASLAFDLGLYAEAIKWDQSLPAGMATDKNTQLRIARALAKSFRVPEAIERFNQLYGEGQLNTAEKLEFAEYLRALNLDPNALPNPELVNKLYQEALAEQPENGDVALRVARFYAEQDNQFDNAVHYYQQAVASAGNSPAIEKEMLDFIKANKTDPAKTDLLFRGMLAENPDNVRVKSAYAEFLSWQGDRRPEAMRMYVDLAKNDPDNLQVWEARLDEVLKWHTPTTELIPLYQEIVNLYPDNKTVWTTVARAYRSNPDYYMEAVETYGRMAKRYPDDGTIKKEWLGLLESNEKQRGDVLKMLKAMAEQSPNDLDIQATYAKILSYERQYGDAMSIFNNVLQQNPQHREALIGKGYTLLWSGKKLEAKNFFNGLRKQYPDDVDVALGLAQADKLIGRYDEALKILKEIRPMLQQRQPESSASLSGFQYVASETPGTKKFLTTYDFSIEPANAPLRIASSGDVPEAIEDIHQNAEQVQDVSGNYAAIEETTPPASQPAVASQPASGSGDDLNALQDDINSLNAAIESLNALQKSSETQLDRIHQTLTNSNDVMPDAMSFYGETGAPGGNGTMTATSNGTARGKGGRLMGEEAMTQQYGVYSALDYDTNPLLSGLGRFRNDDLADMERSITTDLRPMLRAGYLYSTQDGEDTTSKFASYGFPNQLSFSLTPQIRLRGGIRPVKYYIPSRRAVEPDSTWATEYALGGTWKPTDRLTLDGDLAITRFSQSDSTNITFQANAEYAFTDWMRAKIGARRMPQFNSLLTVAGLRPNQGAWDGQLVGQNRENGFFGEINLNPFSPNVDLNLGYEWAFIDGSETPRNYKNQAFASLGYTWHYATNHQLRAGYEFLYFGYSKNTTNGFFDTTSTGVDDPVVSLRPVTRANGGYDFGGYYSPEWFILNAFRLDFRGNFFNKFIEYKIGGSLGPQSYGLGHGIDDDEDSDTSLATSFDANVIMNFTDWLAAYGNVDFLDAGGQFNRWRFGGGLILRPNIPAISPVFGKANVPAAGHGK